MQNLYNSPRVQQELADFQRRLGQIEDGPYKNEISLLMKQLVNEIKKIDAGQHEMISTRREPIFVSETRDNILQLRRKINSQLNRD